MKIQTRSKLWQSRAEQSRAEHLFDVISWVALAAAFLMLVFFLNARIDTLLDSDMSSELVLSRLLAQQGKIITPDWYYSTEIRFLNTQLFYTLFFKLMSDWHRVRILSYICMYIVLIASYWLLCRSLKCEKYFAITAALLLTPFSEPYFFIILKGAYYIPHITITLLTLAMQELFLQADRKRKKWFALLAALLAMAAGMGGPRQVFVLYLPLFLAGAWNWYSQKGKKETEWQLLFTVIAAGSGTAGYVVNRKILAPRYHFASWESMSFTGLDSGRVAQIFNGFLNSYGYQTGGLFSKKALLANSMCLCLILITIYAVGYALKHQDRVSNEYYRLAGFAAALFGIFTLLYLCTNMSYARWYNIPVIVITIPLIAEMLQNLPQEKIKRYLGTLAFTGFVMLNGLIFYRDTWRQDDTLELRQIQRQMVEQEYTSGYATFWRANILTELSNGEIEMWDWCGGGLENIQDVDQTYHWLQLVEHDDTHPEGKVFLFFSKDEFEKCTWYAQLKREHVVYHSDNYVVLGYENYDVMRAEVMPQSTKGK